MGTDVRSSLRVGEVTDRQAWDNFVEQAPDATAMHRWAWREIIEATYGHRSFYLGAFVGSELRGVLPLVRMTSRFFGRRLVSMPYGEGGGPCAPDDATARALVDAAKELAGGVQASLDLHAVREYKIGLPVSLEKVGMTLGLASTTDDLWARLPAERRNRIKKARREGLSASVHGSEALDDFYDVFARNMRDLGSPVHARRFFAEILERLNDRTRLVIVRAGERPVGAAMLLRQRETISIPWVSSLREFFPKSPNQLLYWCAMEHAIAEGARVLDFGRSSVGAGTFEAKRQWGARPVQQYWYYYPEDAGTSAGNASRYGWAMRAWRHLPLTVANSLGPRVRGSIAN